MSSRSSSTPKPPRNYPWRPACSPRSRWSRRRAPPASPNCSQSSTAPRMTKNSSASPSSPPKQVSARLSKPPHQRKIPRRRRREAHRATHEARCEADRAAADGDGEKHARERSRTCPMQLISGFQLTSMEGDLVAFKEGRFQAPRRWKPRSCPERPPRPPQRRSRTLCLPRQIRSRSPHTRCRARSPRRLTRAGCRHEAPRALSWRFSHRSAAAPSTRSPAPKPGEDHRHRLARQNLPQTDLDGPTVERLATVLGDDPALRSSSSSSAASSARSCCSTARTPRGSIRRSRSTAPSPSRPGCGSRPGIGNEDSLLGTRTAFSSISSAPSSASLPARSCMMSAVATKPMTPDLWTHLAVTR
jgi:hypothetical protein